MKDLPGNPAALIALLRGDIDNFEAAITPGGIEAQEARGQQEFVKSEKLPIKYNGSWGEVKDSRPHLEKLGIAVFNAADEHFYHVALPTGWKVAATNHSMWSELLDNKGRKRAAIFFKAAFYDYHAHISLERRFYYGEMPEGGYDNYAPGALYVGYVKDQGATIFQTEPMPRLNSMRDKEDGSMSPNDVARAWLIERYPDFESVYAYWDEQ